MRATLAIAAVSGAAVAGCIALLDSGATSKAIAAPAVVAGLAAAGVAAASERRSRAQAAAVEAKLRAENAALVQRERVLREAVDAAPMAIVLLAGVGRVVYSNAAARELLFEGRPLEGESFLRLLDGAPAAFRDAFLAEGDQLFTITLDGEPETHHLAMRHFEGAAETSTLLVVKHLTRELRRQEVDVWKKLIRVLSHELNNSLAPIASLVHSARRIADNPEQLPKLGRVFDTIEERTTHLSEFLESYARIARLPEPRRIRTSWADFMARVAQLAPGVAVAEPPDRPGWFDPSQLEQVVLNLVKNAEEAGSARVSITVEARAVAGGVDLVVADRGSGMTSEVLARAVLPFYSTKERGSGIGLALCREIAEAHGGKLRLENREGGGLAVTCFVPDRDFVPPASQVRLTLSGTHAPQRT